MSEDLVYGFLAVIAVAAITEIVAYTSSVIRDADAEIERARELSKRVPGQQVDDQVLAKAAADAHREGEGA